MKCKVLGFQFLGEKFGRVKEEFLSGARDKWVSPKSLLETLIIFSVIFSFFSEGVAHAAKKERKRKIRVGLVVDVGGLGDKSFNDSAYLGLLEAEKKLKILSDVGQPSNKLEEEQHLIAFSQNDYDLVIGVGFAMADEVARAAKLYPNKKFAIIDAMVPLPNVACLLFKEHEGSFLVGALGAMMSKTKKVGFVGGMDVPLIHKFETGYKEGCKYIDKDIEIFVKYTGTDPSAWNDPVKGREIALSLITQGCDVVYHAAGGTGGGVIKACKEKNVFAIGVDSDQDGLAPGTVLTSMVKRCNIAVFNTIKSLVDGKFEGGIHYFGLKEDGVDISELKFTKHLIPQESLERLKRIKEDILSGKITVTDYMAEEAKKKAN